jgi:hypothetical protein
MCADGESEQDFYSSFSVCAVSRNNESQLDGRNQFCRRLKSVNFDTAAQAK